MPLTQVQGGMLAGSTNTTTTIQSNGTTAITIDSSQRVGIGTSSPASLLSVNATIGARVTISKTANSINDNDELGSILWRINGGAGTVMGNIYYTGTPTSTADGTGALVFGARSNSGSTSLVESMRITSNGDLYVGTTTGTIGTSNKGFSINGGDGEVRFSRLVGGSSPVMNAYGSQGEARIMGNGNLQNTNSSYGGLSDIKLKENIVDTTSKLEKLNEVRIVNYNLIGSEQKQIGVIAQELEQIFPGMVEEVQDRDADGNDLGTTTKAVKYSVFVPMLIKAMQELNAKVEAQAAEIAALKAAP